MIIMKMVFIRVLICFYCGSFVVFMLIENVFDFLGVILFFRVRVLIVC